MIKEMIMFAILLLLFSLIISIAIVLIILWFKWYSDEVGEEDVLHKNKKSNKRK